MRKYEFEEFKKVAVDAFMKQVPEQFEKRAKNYLGTDEAEGFIKSGYNAYVNVLNDPEEYEDTCGDLSGDAVMMSFADDAASNMEMCY